MGNQEHMFSQNKLEGTLEDVPFEQILNACREHMVTGKVVLTAGTATGEFELRAGIVDTARLGTVSGGAAVRRAKALKNGSYTLIQGLPSLDGEILGSRAEASLADVSLPEVMRHCENNALSCTLAIESEGNVGEILYRVGEIADVLWNGESDEDRIVELVRMKTGKVRVSAPPIDLDIDGWPSAADEEPFSLTESRSLARGTRPAPVRMAGSDEIRIGPLEATSAFLTSPAQPRKKSTAETVEQAASETAVTRIAEAKSETSTRKRRDTTAVIRKPRAQTAEQGPSWMFFVVSIGLAFALGAAALWFAGA